MSDELKEKIIKRVKSFAWRLGCAMAIAGLNFVSEQLTTVSLPSWAVGVIGLAIGEATKWVNDHTNLLGGGLKKVL